MNKQEFFEKISSKLEGLPEEDIKKSLDYYNEMIEDRIEEGLSEEEAVEAMGSPEEIAEQILMDTSLPKLVKAKVKPKRPLAVWEIVLIVLGFPVWFPLLAAFGVVLLSVYIVIWSVILVLFSVDLALAVSGVSTIIGSIAMIFCSSIQQGLYYFGFGLLMCGLAVMLFFGSIYTTKKIIVLSKLIIKGIKSCFIRRSEA